MRAARRRRLWRRTKHPATLFFVFALLTSALTPASDADERSAEVSRVFFIPFRVTTYVPVKKADIEDKSLVEILFVKGNRGTELHPVLRRIRTLLEAHRSNRRLDENFIRMKVELEVETYYVDASGVVLKDSSGQNFQLQKAEMAQTEGLIQGLQGVVDAKAAAQIRVKLK